MADFPQRSQSQKSSSLAEMAAKAAQRSASNRPPPISYSAAEASAARRASAPPPPSSFSGFNGASTDAGHASGDGSGLIHLQRMQATSSLTPQTRGVESRLAPPVIRGGIESNPFEKKGRSRAVLTGFIIVLLGIGTAYGVAAKRGVNPIAATKSFISSLRGGSDASGGSQFSVKEEPAKVDSPIAAQPAGPKGIAPGNLPAAAAVAPSEPTDIVGDSKGHSVKAARPAERSAPAVAAAAPAPKAEAPAQPAAAPAPPAAEPAGPPGLAGAIKKAVGPQQPAAKEEAAAPAAAPAVRGDIPEAPPQGAIQGALGSQRGAARNCVAGHDGPSRATLVFASTGKVQSVSVSGPAAGTPAEGCIKSVLSKANVGPFQRSTFSVSTTISPP